jgi:hypothetical protein
MTFDSILGSGKFAAGVLTFVDHYAGDPNNTRIVVPVTFETIATTAILDTGAPWCVLNPDEAETLHLEDRADCWEPPTPLRIRGIAYRRRLCRVSTRFKAEVGAQLIVEATVFVPLLVPNETWRHPNFLGLDGLLSRMRFAIDPERNHFFFAPLGEH